MAKRDEFSAATRRAASRRAAEPVALAARYDRRRDRVVVRLNTGLELAQLGATGGRVRSAAKRAAARTNGKKGGRPRKLATA